MKKAAAPLLPLLATLMLPAQGGEAPSLPTAADLAGLMKQAKLSEGFEARLKLTTVNPDGQHSAPIRLAIIGQFSKDKQRLSIRGISPESVRDRSFAAERNTAGRIRALSFTNPAMMAVAETDPFARVFGTGLVLWDLFGPWWDWPKQSLAEARRQAGRVCLTIRSRADEDTSPIWEVLNCMDQRAGLSLHTQLLDKKHKTLRSITVTQTQGKESGLMAAKAMSITEADNTQTEVEIYSGDEHYAISPDTFAVLDARPPEAH